jgi:hypothetical protein
MISLKPVSIFLYLLLEIACYSCSPAIRQDEGKNSERKQKPPSSFQDSLTISSTAVVFYGPDSLQLKELEAITEERIFKGSTHEFFYQQRNAHIFLKQYWPQLKVYDVTRVRFLRFIKTDKTVQLIDLNDVADAYGMFVFDPSKAPEQLDMMNIETQVPEYFKKN